MKRRRRNPKKEKAIMLMSSLFMLTALTVTGVYVKERNKVKEDYVVDLSDLQETEEAEELAKIEDSGTEVKKEEVQAGVEESQESQAVTSTQVKNTVETSTQEGEEQIEEEKQEEEKQKEEKQVSQESAPTQELVFPEEESLVWPITGNVLIAYSMDKPVYFASLEQYKMNPGIVIQADEGQQIHAAAKGRVIKITKEDETGNTICMDIGSGYEAVYGQLTNLQVKEGDLLEKGGYLGDVAAPTSYYSVEGSNVYFALRKNGKPVDPMGKLE